MSPKASPAQPIYTMQLEDHTSATKMYMIICDEGWRTMIVCTGMYEWAAKWMLEILKGHRYARPD